LKTARTIADLRETLASLPRPLGIVPTMGALHEGHLALIDAARRECATVGISIFVNPTQFGPGEDFSKYPRDENRDVALATARGADVAFCPTVDEIYAGASTFVTVENVSDGYEGAIRPGHFRGVATVVAKLFHIFSPDAAYFGWKDLQQCAVIRRMIEDLKMPIQLRLVETVRGPGGLALSSRNAYLTDEARQEATLIYQTLAEARRLIGQDSAQMETVLRSSIQALEGNGMTVDYFDLVDANTMKPLREIRPTARLTTAVRKDGVRLLDNIPILDTAVDNKLPKT